MVKTDRNEVLQPGKVGFMP